MHGLHGALPESPRCHHTPQLHSESVGNGETATRYAEDKGLGASCEAPIPSAKCRHSGLPRTHRYAHSQSSPTRSLGSEFPTLHPPAGHRQSSEVDSLADKISDDPMFFSLLKVLRYEVRCLWWGSRAERLQLKAGALNASRLWGKLWGPLRK